MNLFLRSPSVLTAMLLYLKLKSGRYLVPKLTRKTSRGKECRSTWVNKTLWSSATVATFSRLRPRRWITNRKTTRAICYPSREPSIWLSTVSGVRTAKLIFALSAVKNLTIWAKLAKKLNATLMLRHAVSALMSWSNLQVDEIQRLETAVTKKIAQKSGINAVIRSYLVGIGAKALKTRRRVCHAWTKIASRNTTRTTL